MSSKYLETKTVNRLLTSLEGTQRGVPDQHHRLKVYKKWEKNRSQLKLRNKNDLSIMIF